MNGPKSPLITSSIGIKPVIINKIQAHMDKNLNLPQKNNTNSFVNLSMRNVNKTINVAQKESFLWSSRESTNYNFIANNPNVGIKGKVGVILV